MKKVGKFFFWLSISGAIVLTIFSVVCLSYVINVNNQIDYNQNILIEANSKVELFDTDNNSLSSYDEQTTKISLEQLPSYVPESFISIEDKNFYKHNGINYKRMIKALINNIKSMSAKEGASTISQQLVKNSYLSSDKTINRKVKEVLLTKRMEKEFSKQEILETYLNVIYFGNHSYGLEQASKNYFNKSAKELSLAESATLAGIIKSPKLYSPIYNYENCLNRRNLVLNEMLKDKKISEDEYNNAINSKIELSLNETTLNKHFYEQASLQEACEILGIDEKQLAMQSVKIFTYLDEKDQTCLKSAINNEEFYHINSYGNTADSCGMIIDNKTGGITAFTGKSVYDIINMKRSPGSTIKPILVYAPALEDGKISPSTPILDEKTDFSGYSPNNVGGQYYGWISARKTLEKSLNIPAIKIMQYTGLERCKNFARKAGITFDKTDNSYALALGAFTNGLTVKEVVNSFIPFANSGKFISAKFIRKICDKKGNLIYEHNQQESLIMSEETAYLLTDMLKTSTKTGTSSRLKDLDFDIAGKTGTVGIKNTNLNSDIWSVGYTSEKTCGIWLGNSTNEKEFMLEGSNNGGTYATSMLNNVMKNMYKSTNPEKFKKPERVKEVLIDSLELENNHCLKLADEMSPEIFKEKALFNQKYIPREIGASFTELSVVKLNITLDKNKPKLTFNCLPQCEYKIYRIEEDTTTLLKTIKNKRGVMTYVDNETILDTQYEYFVEAIIHDYSKNQEIKKIKSNSIKIFTPSTFTINNQSLINRNYLFA